MGLVGTLLVVSLLGQSGPVDVTPPNIVRTRAWLPTTIGAVALAGGLTALIVGEVSYGRAQTDSGRTLATSSIVGGTALSLVGGVVLGVATMMWLWEPSLATPHLAFVVTRSGGVLSFGGRF